MRRVFIATLSLVWALGCGGAQTPTAEQAQGPAGGAVEPPASFSSNRPADGTASAAPAPGLAIIDNATMRLEGTPAVPAELEQRLAQYLDTRSAVLADLDERGSRILALTRFADTNQAHLVAMPMGARTQLTFRNEPISYATFVPGQSGDILYVADVGGNEQHQIYRLEVATGRTVRLTEAKSRNGKPIWSPDGAWIAYSSNARNGRDFDIWIADGRDPASAQRVADATGWWEPIDWSRDGKKILVHQEISANESRLYIVDRATKEVRRITPETPKDGQKINFGPARFGADGKTLYVASDREGEFVELYETDLAGSAWRPLSRSIPWDVEDIEVSPDGRTVAITVNEGGPSTLHLLDTRSRKLARVSAVPRGGIHRMRFARKASILGFTLSGERMPGDAYTYDIARRKLVRWTESELGGINPETLIESTLVELTSFDGTKVPAFYARPRGEGPFPVIIEIHGGPESQARPRFSPLAQYLLAESKIALLIPNVRGSAGYGKTYLTKDNGTLREDSVKDIGALLDWIAQQPELDAKRVGVIGGSYGGYMTLASLVQFGDRIAAGVDIVGISNFVTFLTSTAEYRRDLRRVEYGDERDPEMKAFLERISPANNAGKIKSALFVAQGANDPRVPASEAEQIVRAVRGAGHDVWYFLAKNEGHGFAKKENRDLFYSLTVMFFEKHLGTGK